MSLIDDLRGLSQHLSPSFKVKGGEALDVLSALVQYAEHGSPVFEAAAKGAQEVADFYHEIEAGKAEVSGVEAPQKGQPVATAPQAPTSYPGAVSQGVSAQQFAELVQVVQGLAAAVSNQNRPTAADVTVQPTEPAPAPAEPAPAEPAPAPAHAPDPQTNVFGG